MAGIFDMAMGALGGANPIGMGVSLAGQIFGAVKGAQAQKKMQQELDRQKQENKAMYDNTANKDFLETTAAKGFVTEAKDALDDERKAVAGRAAVTGGSDEAAVAGNTAATRNYGNRLSQLAGLGTNYQQRAEAMYRGTKNNLDAQQMDLNAQKGDSASALMSNASDLMNTASLDLNNEDLEPDQVDLSRRSKIRP